MVSVERGRPPENNSNSRRRLRTFPHRLHIDPDLAFTSLADSFFEDMAGGPALLNPMFPSPSSSFFHSMWDDIRPARRRYRVTSPSSPTWSRPSWASPKYETLRSPSPPGKVIPIKVEHITESRTPDTNKKWINPSVVTSSSKSEPPIVVDDEPVEVPIIYKSASADRSCPGISSHRRFSRNVCDSDSTVSVSPIKIEEDVIINKSSVQSLGARRSLFTHSKTLGDERSKHTLRDKSYEMNISNNSSGNDKDSERLSRETSSCSISNAISVDDIEVDVSSAVEKPSELSQPFSSSSDPSPSVSKTSTEDDEKEVNPAPSYPVYDILKDKLAQENRQIDYIRGDGNCFFRALSKQLYGSERFHKTIRSLIVDVIATNKDKFAQFVDGEDVQTHVMRMAEDHSWATTCEIYAAATLLQRDIYMLTPNHRNIKYSWLHFRPVFALSTDSVEVSHHPCYISLCNTNGNHYDRVVADHGGCNCFLPHPEMDGVSFSVDLTS
ncbi:OVARIAN TUMOR DOMAIN-containing deubiquitinating enzyme 6 [Aplysia californica]|uniref:OVARIAN TUMOR DOMAIN-containing deubiquitinating enzyme 6 n=1 Tax=Aplysia californica TaxID=6500 RepID=A0ABM0JHB8_APLCA|nr:OVARIAN TUMOR DOMAIN-containing deubiquitinating enzyme 6 [Aplysia californica]